VSFINDGAKIKSYDLCVIIVVNKSNIQSKTPSRVTLTRDSMVKILDYR
jgi:hypothetical protein